MGGKPLSREIINRRIADRGIVMLGEYVRQYIPARFRCSKGHEWDARPGNVLCGKGCPTCGRASAAAKMRLSVATVRRRLAEKGIALAGDYVDTQTRTSFRCEEGHVWVTTPTSVMSRTGCPECAGNRPLTKEVVNSRLEDRDATLVGEYHGAHESTLFECSEGHTWLARPANVLNLGRDCPHCAGQFPLTRQIVNERIAHRGITMVGEYSNSQTNTSFTCSEGHTWEARPNNVIQGSGCQICAGNAPLTTEAVNERIASRGIRLLDHYRNNQTAVRFLCEEGHIWKARPGNVFSGRGCPTCAERTSDNDVFYLWIAGPQDHVALKQDEWLLKYGVSSERRGDLRTKEVAWAWGTTANVIAIIKTPGSALDVENSVAQIGRRPPRKLSHMDGWTEFRVVDEPQLAQFVSIADEAAEYKILWNNPVPDIRPCGYDQLKLDL